MKCCMMMNAMSRLPRLESLNPQTVRGQKFPEHVTAIFLRKSCAGSFSRFEHYNLALGSFKMSSSSSSESTSSASSPSPSPPPSIRKRKRTTSTSAENQEEPAVTLLDEPTPLSHAEKRRQKKGKSLKSPNPKDDGADAPVAAKRVDEDSAADAAAKAKRQNSVWVGNLSFKTTADSLKAFLSGAGEITRVMMPMKPATAPGAGKWKDAAPVKAAENKGCVTSLSFAWPSPG